MLLSIQFPIADSRRFLSADTGVLKRPTWPSPTHSEFVRYFGNVKARKLGGVNGWVGENDICEAVRALRFLPSPHLAYRCAFRRFFFDGWALGKYELGLASRKAVFVNDWDAKDVLDNFLGTFVKIGPRTGGIDCALSTAGRHIANLYSAATTAGDADPPQEWWVEAGTPTLLLEHHEDEIFTLPARLKATSLSVPSEYGISLTHCFVTYNSQRFPLWLIGRQYGRSDRKISYWDTFKREAYLSRFNKSRTLRLYLLRLHAEHQCLQIVLRNISTGKIPIIHGSPETATLQQYLFKATQNISNMESRSVAKDVATLARNLEDDISPGQREALLSLLARENLRFSVRRNVAKYIDVIVQSGGILNMADKIHSGDDIHVSGGQVGAIGRNAHVHDFDLNQVWQESGGEIDLATLEKELTLLIPELRKRATELTHDKAILAVGEAAEAAKRGEGPQVLKSLRSAGKWVFEVATDIGVRVAAETINKVLLPSG